MRNYRRPQKFIVLFFAAIFILLSFPFLKSNLYKLSPSIHKIGEKLALFAAFSDMPKQSAQLLEKRFNDEIFYEDEPDTTPQQNPNPPASSKEASSVPQADPRQDASSGGEATEQEASSRQDASGGEEPPPPAAQDASSSSSASGSGSAPDPAPKQAPPEIPEKYRGDMKEEDLSGYDTSTYLKLDPGYLRNYTKYSAAEIKGIVSEPPDLPVGDAGEPQVLIYHTHATEAFERYDNIFYDTRNNWRSTDNNMNMVAVGDALAQSLRENGINVLHDTTQHDYPSYNGAYDRSAQTVQRYLEEYPSIKILLDVHRDAIDRNGTLIRPVTEVDGKKAAQLMIIAGCDDGTMNMPNWRENLRFAAAIQRNGEAAYEHLMRPIFFCYRKYNLDMTNGSLLLEFGSHGNTLEECVTTAKLMGKPIAQAILELQTGNTNENIEESGD